MQPVPTATALDIILYSRSVRAAMRSTLHYLGCAMSLVLRGIRNDARFTHGSSLTPTLFYTVQPHIHVCVAQPALIMHARAYLVFFPNNKTVWVMPGSSS